MKIEGSSSIQGVEMHGFTLTIQFKSGKSYQYEDVPLDVQQGLINAKSAGKYFATEIRPVFEGKPVQEQDEDGEKE